MPYLQINGVDMPAPADIGYDYSDIDSDNSKRTEGGYMQRDRIRADIRKIPFMWNKITSADVHKILMAVEPSSFTATFFDVKSDAEISLSVYAGPKTVKTTKTAIGFRYDLSFDLIEN